MRIAVLALDGVFDTGLAAVLDAFRTANELAGLSPDAHAPFELTLTSVLPNVRTAQGLGVPVAPLDACGLPDLAIVPAIGYKMPEPLARALDSEEVREAGAVLRRWAELGVRIAAPCIGAFVLAEAGLLDGQEATCTWWLAPMFRERYPLVELDPRRMVVPSGPFVTAGAALGHLDLALWLIRQSSPELASLVARYLIVDARPSQSAYVISDHLLHDDPLVSRFDRWAREHLAERFSLDAAAAALATSKRTLARRLDETLGKTPVEHVQDLRVERAVHLLRTSDLAVERIAEQVGYRDGVTLRSLLRKRLGKGVRELRG
ncbi:GlxA family transcriptional regulator [Massilia sp. ST3]|uniref:GlxA family transcriptional regulator n=1 Tax=Massilia sp. ST3 TaxID=2824903 RepID=UPI001B817607|nr:helix-turn-helix domain-containing protein [Massilia sp. ST3]MBQ5946390.1 helix-turn-helix domain-containing protein [Massilia sp. ST3]